jgi:hypothetical protein
MGILGLAFLWLTCLFLLEMLFLFVLFAFCSCSLTFRASRSSNGLFPASFVENWVEGTVPTEGSDVTIDLSRTCDSSFSPAVLWDLSDEMGVVTLSAAVGLCPTVVLVPVQMRASKIVSQGSKQDPPRLRPPISEEPPIDKRPPVDEGDPPVGIISRPRERRNCLDGCTNFRLELMGLDGLTIATFFVTGYSVDGSVFASTEGNLILNEERYSLTPNVNSPDPSPFLDFEYDGLFDSTGSVFPAGLLFQSEDLTKSVRLFMSFRSPVTLEVREGANVIQNATGVLLVSVVPEDDKAAVMVYTTSPSSRLEAVSCFFGMHTLVMGFGVVQCSNSTEIFGTVVPGHPLVYCQRCFPGIFNLGAPRYGTLTFAGGPTLVV